MLRRVARLALAASLALLTSGSALGALRRALPAGGRAGALQQAQLTLIRVPGTAHP